MPKRRLMVLVAGALLAAALVPSPGRAVYVVQVYRAALASFEDVQVTPPGEIDPQGGHVFVLAVDSIGVRNQPTVIVETGATPRCIELHGAGLIEVGCGVPILTMGPGLEAAGATGAFSSTVCDAETGETVASSTISYTASWTASDPRVVYARATVREDPGTPNPIVGAGISRQASAVISVTSAYLGTPTIGPSENGLLLEGVDIVPLYPIDPGSCGVSPFA